jgi:hypothetical protein
MDEQHSLPYLDNAGAMSCFCHQDMISQCRSSFKRQIYVRRQQIYQGLCMYALVGFDNMCECIYTCRPMENDQSLLHRGPSYVVSHICFSKPPPDATQILHNLKTMLGRKVILHALHFMLWDNIDWVYSGNTILLVEDLFTLHVRCHRPGITLHVHLVRTSSIQGPPVLR